MAKRNSKRRPWTSADVRELKSAARNKTPARKIARSLKRSEGATRQKAFSLGLSLDSARVKNIYSQLRHQAKDRGTAVTKLRTRARLRVCALNR